MFCSAAFQLLLFPHLLKVQGRENIIGRFWGHTTAGLEEWPSLRFSPFQDEKGNKFSAVPCRPLISLFVTSRSPLGVSCSWEFSLSMENPKQWGDGNSCWSFPAFPRTQNSNSITQRDRTLHSQNTPLTSGTEQPVQDANCQIWSSS